MRATLPRKGYRTCLISSSDRVHEPPTPILGSLQIGAVEPDLRCYRGLVAGKLPGWGGAVQRLDHDRDNALGGTAEHGEGAVAQVERVGEGAAIQHGDDDRVPEVV